MNELERLIEDRRIEKAMNKWDYVTKVLGISYQTYQRVVSEPIKCQMTIIKHVADVLGITTSELFRLQKETI